MSWSASAKGDKAAVLDAVGKQLDSAAQGYSAQRLAEGATVHAVRGALLHAIAGFTVRDDEEISVTGSGSQAESYVSLTISASVIKKTISAPDQAAP